MKTHFSKILIWFIWVAIVAASFKLNKISSRETNVITWDVYGYYLYLPALLTYHDTRDYSFTKEHFAHYNISSSFYQLNNLNDSLKAPIYSVGMAIIYAPFYIISDTFCRVNASYPRDGLSFPYQFAMVFASWAYAFLGLYFLRKFLIKYFSDKVVAIAITGICLGTNYFHYAAFESGMPHAYLFSLYALLLYLIDFWHEKATIRNSLLIGCLIGLACIARPSEVVFGIYFLLFGIHSQETLRKKANFLKDNSFQVLLMLVAALLMASVQILYWKVNLGKWIYNGYAGHHFDFLKPHLIDGFFSYRKGWLLYSPLISLSIVGLIFLSGHLKKFRWAIISFFIINSYVVFSWHIWWYASSFGARGVIQSYALLSVPFAALVQYAFSKNILKIALFVAMLFFVALNHFQDWQYRNRILPFDETSKTYYWKIFSKTVVSKNTRKYLDVNEILPDINYRETLLATLIFHDDSLCEMQADKSALRIAERTGFSPSLEIEIDKSNRDKLSKKWLQIEADVFQKGDKFDQWGTAYLCLSVERNGKVLKWVGLRFQQFTDQENWDIANFESQLPRLSDGDVIRLYVWNQGPDKIWINAIKAFVLNPEK